MTFLSRTSTLVRLSLAALFLAAVLTGCSSGSTVMLSGSKPATGLPVEQVRLYTDAPRSGYQTIALITASADVGSYLSVDRAEAAALDKLKEEAAEAGADGVIEIQREMVENGTVTNTRVWGRATEMPLGGGVTAERAEVGGRSSTYVSRTIVFRAKAIRGGGPVTAHTAGSASTGATTIVTPTSSRTTNPAQPARSSAGTARRRR